MCVPCTGFPASSGTLSTLGRGAGATLRRGVWLVALAAALPVVFVWLDHGPGHAWRLAGALMHPSVILGIVPLAWILGAVATVIVRWLDRYGPRP